MTRPGQVGGRAGHGARSEKRGRDEHGHDRHGHDAGKGDLFGDAPLHVGRCGGGLGKHLGHGRDLQQRLPGPGRGIGPQAVAALEGQAAHPGPALGHVPGHLVKNLPVFRTHVLRLHPGQPGVAAAPGPRSGGGQELPFAAWRVCAFGGDQKRGQLVGDVAARGQPGQQVVQGGGDGRDPEGMARGVAHGHGHGQDDALQGRGRVGHGPHGIVRGCGGQGRAVPEGAPGIGQAGLPALGGGHGGQAAGEGHQSPQGEAARPGKPGEIGRQGGQPGHLRTQGGRCDAGWGGKKQGGAGGRGRGQGAVRPKQPVAGLLGLAVSRHALAPEPDQKGGCGIRLRSRAGQAVLHRSRLEPQEQGQIVPLGLQEPGMILHQVGHAALGLAHQKGRHMPGQLLSQPLHAAHGIEAQGREGHQGKSQKQDEELPAELHGRTPGPGWRAGGFMVRMVAPLGRVGNAPNAPWTGCAVDRMRHGWNAAWTGCGMAGMTPPLLGRRSWDGVPGRAVGREGVLPVFRPMNACGRGTGR
ncbi:hypothetical protein ASZ90_001960 [hydrocarbon metagenome]|uniref:Uncharacterized protein n=1 Tax=hydrocarbon metagenome TaxID=938273 RepID=A0A0W8G551_9ZZZZ